MEVEITIDGVDEEGEGDPILVISNGSQENIVKIHIFDGHCDAEIKIEDLKLALRKISAK